MKKIIFMSLICLMGLMGLMYEAAPAYAANSGNFTMALWVNSTTSVASKAIIGKAEEFRIFTNSSGLVGCQVKTATWQTAAQASTKALAVGTWAHVICTYDLTNLKVYVNGMQVASQALTSLPDDTSNALKIGQDDSASTLYSNLSGTIDEFKFYTYALTADEVKLDYNKGSSQVLGATGNNSTYQSNAANQEYCVPGDTTSCAAPVGRWDFEERTGQSANDASGNGNTGTLGAGVASKRPAWSTGKAGAVLNFDGSDDYIDIGDKTSLDLTNTGTIETWIYARSFGSWEGIVRKGTGGGDTNLYTLYWRGDGLGLEGNIADASGRNSVAYTTPLLTNTWYHVAFTWDGSKLKLFINGVKESESNQTRNANSAGGSFQIGTGRWTTIPLDGKIDQVRVFNYARSSAQVAYDYNRGGPVASYDFDECEGNTVHDLSGNSNNGTITVATGNPLGTCTTSNSFWGGSAGTGAGKRNSAPTFDGTDDKVTVTTAISGVQSVSFWVKPATNTDSFMDLDGGTHYITASSGTVSATGFSSPAIYVNGVSGGTITGGAWNHIVITTGTSFNTTSSMTFGYKSAATADYLNGQMDDVQIYNYALTAAQIKNLYNNGAIFFGPATGAP